MRPKSWIYVTGAPRSGTTFVGKVLSMPPTVDYIHEPFNPDCGLPGVDQRFAYVDADDPDPAWVARTDSLQAYEARLRTGYYPEDTPGRRWLKTVIGSRGPFYYRLARLNPVSRHAVVKDPIGCLMTEFLARHFSMAPVILIRHPAAFVSSYKRLSWTPQLGALRQQPALVSRYFGSGKGLDDTGDPIVDAARLWAALHTVIGDQIDRNPDWIVVRHEDLSVAPAATFESLYHRLGLNWTPRVSRRIEGMTRGSNRSEAKASKVQDFKRDSSSLLSLRLDGLTLEEHGKIVDAVSPVALRWYPNLHEQYEARQGRPQKSTAEPILIGGAAG